MSAGAAVTGCAWAMVASSTRCGALVMGARGLGFGSDGGAPRGGGGDNGRGASRSDRGSARIAGLSSFGARRPLARSPPAPLAGASLERVGGRDTCVRSADSCRGIARAWRASRGIARPWRSSTGPMRSGSAGCSDSPDPRSISPPADGAIGTASRSGRSLSNRGGIAATARVGSPGRAGARRCRKFITRPPSANRPRGGPGSG